MSLPKGNQRVGGNEFAKDGGKDGAADALLQPFREALRRHKVPVDQFCEFGNGCGFDGCGFEGID